ncbi:hypothetical protein Tco_1301324 [Tanacetum coccineum]
MRWRLWENVGVAVDSLESLKQTHVRETAKLAALTDAIAESLAGIHEKERHVAKLDLNDYVFIGTRLRKTYEHTGETLWNKRSGVESRLVSLQLVLSGPGELPELFLAGWTMAGAKRHPGSGCSRQSTSFVKLNAQTMSGSSVKEASSSLRIIQSTKKSTTSVAISILNMDSRQQKESSWNNYKDFHGKEQILNKRGVRDYE